MDDTAIPTYRAPTPTEERAEAELAKLRAETHEIEARMARAAEVARQADERFAIRKQVMNIDLAKNKRDEALILSQWQYQHTFNFIGHVGKDTIQPCMDRLNSWHVMDPGCDITIIFNSPGGSVIDGMALFDYIRFVRREGHKVTCMALGYAASMAGILVQAASEGCRVMAKGSWLLIHEVAFSTSGKIGEIEDMYKFGERMKKQAADIFLERSGGKLTMETLTANLVKVETRAKVLPVAVRVTLAPFLVAYFTLPPEAPLRPRRLSNPVRHWRCGRTAWQARKAHYARLARLSALARRHVERARRSGE